MTTKKTVQRAAMQAWSVPLAVQVHTPLTSIRTPCAMSVNLAKLATQMEALGASTVNLANLRLEEKALGALTAHQGKSKPIQNVLTVPQVSSKVFPAAVIAIRASRGDTVPA